MKLFKIRDVNGNVVGIVEVGEELEYHLTQEITYSLSASIISQNADGTRSLLELNVSPTPVEEITDDYKRGLRDGHSTQAKMDEERIHTLESEVKRLEEHLSPTYVDRKRLIKNAQAPETD